ncbi:MAG: glucokinase [Pseudomonadota bacterium]
MKAATAEHRWLIADIGGTNSRLAVWHDDETPGGSVHGTRKLTNDAYVEIHDMLGTFLDGYDGPPPTAGILAIAGPVVGDEVALLNIDWAFSVNGLREQLGLSQLVVINDFEALAHVVPMLEVGDYIEIGNGRTDPRAPSVLIGPGTGLGVASLIPTGQRYVAVPGEGGHATLAAANDEEARILSALRDRFDHVSAERMLSGEGLTLLHQTLHNNRLPAAEISVLANKGDPSAIATFEQYFSFLGTVAGNLALTMGAHGGVYIGGGIIPANRSLFENSGFRERFVDKGRFRGYLERISTRLITRDTPALLGLTGLAINLSRSG